MPASRRIFTLIAVTCAALLGFGYYLQYGAGLEPCPLCLLQRIAFFFVLLAGTAAAVHGPGKIGARVYGGLIAAGALIGGGIAARQVWLQHLPPEQVPECSPGLDYLLDAFPLAEALHMVFTGSGECAEVDWTFLSLSIAEWSLAWFVVLAVGAIYAGWLRMIDDG
jgi:disulfide bond formation protein DsbB